MTIPITLESILQYLSSQGISDVSFSRVYIPKEALEDLSDTTLEAIVFPSDDVSEIVDRSNISVTRTYHIVFSGRVPRETMQSTLDTFITKVDSVKQILNSSLRGDSLLLPLGERLDSISVAPVYDYDKLANNGVFQSLINLSVVSFDEY